MMIGIEGRSGDLSANCCAQKDASDRQSLRSLFAGLAGSDAAGRREFIAPRQPTGLRLRWASGLFWLAREAAGCRWIWVGPEMKKVVRSENPSYARVE